MGVPEQLVGLDLAAALARVGGDEELLKEIAGIFLDQYPEELSEVRKAVETRNPHALECAAHSLKGSVGNFGAQQAYDAAFRLELMGRKNELSHSTDTLAELEKAIGSLREQLMKLART